MARANPGSIAYDDFAGFVHTGMGGILGFTGWNLHFLSQRIPSCDGHDRTFVKLKLSALFVGFYPARHWLHEGMLHRAS